MESSDRELLLEFVHRHNTLAFTTLMQRHSQLVRQVCRRILRDDHLAEDASQATFLVLARDARKLCQYARNLAAWLHTVATNASLQMRRSRTAMLGRERGYQLQRSDVTGLAELLGMLDEELQRLPSEDREAIVYCHLAGMTQEQAAAELRVSISTLRRRLDRGIQSLKRQFARRGLWVPVFAVIWSALSDASDAAGRDSEHKEHLDNHVPPDCDVASPQS